ncbi:hypothetical protein E9529_13115 [Blastococcus sp. KM273128]|uniref:lipopolysaccharide biosynthesis protein n=1 Tax=Blastococcus sp. KM273128 TaxID=2570314 RepID=UPI001F172CD9|nr:hypothetical protein [Blastococcus sp. KM273128]MCF6745197.1 hypothetical protein [Blastococcus sp. KM273128]
MAALLLALWGNALLLSLRAAGIAGQDTSRFLRTMLAAQVILVTGAGVLLALSVESPPVWLCLYGSSLLIPTLLAVIWSPPKVAADAEGRTATRKLGLRLAPTMVANMVMLRADRLLLPVLSSPEQLGLYVVVAAVTELIAWPVQAFVDGRVPLWRVSIDMGTLSVGKILGFAAAFTGLGSAVVALSLAALLIPVFGEEYSPARQLVWPLAAAGGLYAFSRVGLAMAVAGNRSRLAASIDISGMMVAAAAYIVLIPEHGATGAALGSLLGYGIAALASAAVVWRMAWSQAVVEGSSSDAS